MMNMKMYMRKADSQPEVYIDQAIEHDPVKPGVMNLLFIVDGYYPSMGGAEKQVELLTKELSRRGHNVKVYAPHLEKQSPLKEELDGVSIERIPYPHIKKIGVFILLLRFGLKLFKERKNFDAIHIHMVRNLAAMVGFMKPMLKSTVVAKISGAWEFEGGILDPSHASHPLYRMMNYFIKRLDCFQAISKYTVLQLQLAGYPVKKIKHIPNAIDTNRFSYKERNSDTGDLNVVYTGRLRHVKGVDVLIDAWSRVVVSSDNQKLRLLIAGNGPFRSELEKKVQYHGLQDSITFLGLVSDIPELLSNSHIYVQPSRQEGLSNSVLEAMAAGLPIVATNISGNEDLVSNGDNGILVEPENDKTLSESILELVDNPDLRIEMGKRSREIIEQGYQVPAVLNNLISVYQGS